MFISNYQGVEYCFYDDRVTVDGASLFYSEMVDIAHRGGETPAFVFTYGDRRMTIPYDPKDRNQILQYFMHANKLQPQVSEAQGDSGSTPQAQPEQASEPEFVYEPEVAEAAAEAEVKTSPEPEFVYEPEVAEAAVAPEAETSSEPEFIYEPEVAEAAAATEAEGSAEPEFVYESDQTGKPTEEDFVYESEEAVAAGIVEEPTGEPEEVAEEVIYEAEASAYEYAGEEAVEEDFPYENGYDDVQPHGGMIYEDEGIGSDDLAAAGVKSRAASGKMKSIGSSIGAIPGKFTALPKRTLIIIAIAAGVVIAGIACFVLFGMGKSVEGIDGRISPEAVTTDSGEKYMVSTISSDVDMEDFALSYYDKCFSKGDTVHWIINEKTNETIMISDNEGTVLVCTFDHVDGEEDNPVLLGSGTLKETWLMYPENEEIFKI